MRPLTLIMAAAALLLGNDGRAAGRDALPGSALSVGRAKHDARSIVVAEVRKTGDVLPATASRPAVQMWTELKPSAVRKGVIGEADLNRLPLSIRIEGDERFPRDGEELIFFIGSEREGGAIIKVLAKTQANLAAIEATPPEPPAAPAGMLPGGGIGGRLSPAGPSPAPSYRGTTIVPGAGATGDLLKVQNQFAAALSHGDPTPEDRQAHFAWLDQNEYVRRYGVRQIGWYGSILGCEPRAGGGWLVTVKIAPWLYATRGLRHTLVLDSVEETYEFVDGRIRLVESTAAVAKLNRQGFPVAW